MSMGHPDQTDRLTPGLAEALQRVVAMTAPSPRSILLPAFDAVSRPLPTCHRIRLSADPGATDSADPRESSAA